jgi:hypothetical protein
VRIPAEYSSHGDDVYVRRDPKTGVRTLSESSFAPSLDEIYAQLDAAGIAHFTPGRDLASPRDQDPLMNPAARYLFDTNTRTVST